VSTQTLGGSSILGIGAYRPRRSVPNSEIVDRIDSSDEWIRTRSGITARRIADADETVISMSVSAANDALAVQYPYANNGVDNDVMVLEWVDYDNSDWVRIKPRHTYTNDGNVHNDKCLAVKGASMASGASIVQHTCTYDSANNDVWRAQLVRLSNGTFAYQFRNLNSNMCIAVRSASFTPGAELIQYACNGTTNSLWG